MFLETKPGFEIQQESMCPTWAEACEEQFNQSFYQTCL